MNDAYLQNINLLPERFIVKEIPLSAQKILQYIVFLSFFFALLMAIQVFRLERAKSEEAKTIKRLEVFEFHLQDFMQNNTKPSLDKQLEANLNALKSTLNTKKELLNKISGLTIDEVSGFSHYLTGLATHKVDQLWLTNIQLQNDGQYIHIDGQTLDPKQVPHYLKALNSSPAFSGKVFNTIALNRATTEQNNIDFSLTLGVSADETEEEAEIEER